MLELLPPQEAARYEIKIGLPESQLSVALAWLTRHGFSTLFPKRRVNSAYFDTYAFDCLVAADAGISARVKPRVRWYGDTDCPNKMRLEAKCKRGQAGYKWTAPLVGPWDLRRDTWTQLVRQVRKQLSGPMELLLDTAPMASAITRYDRDYFGSPDRRLRVTIDSRVTLIPQLTMRPDLRRRAILDPLLIVEIKASVDDRAYVADLMLDSPGRPSRLSKYGTALDLRRW